MFLQPIFIITISFIIFLAYDLIQRLKFKLPPGPKPWPIIGNLYNIKPIQFRCFYEWAEIYGPIISVWFGPNLTVVISSPELAQQVLKEHDQELANRQRVRSQASFTKDGMDLTWADYGPHYVKVRKVCNLELFTSKKIEVYRPIREDEVTAMIEFIYKDCTYLGGENNGKVLIMLRKYLGQVALNHITRLTFGKRFLNSEDKLDSQGKELMGILLDVRNIKKPNMVVEHVPWLQWMSFFYDGALEKHRDRMDRFAKEIMEEDNKRNFVNGLLLCKDKYDLSEDTIIGLLWDMIMAGMDTIAITVEWAMAELMRHQRVLKKAQYELDHIIGQERIVTEGDLVNMPYIQAIIKEALRLHPPTPLMLPHRANANVKIGGYDVPKGTTVLVNIWAIARDPTIWSDPHEFRPERFLEEDIDMKGHDFRLLPFGSGRRVCLGVQMGINLVTLILGRLLHHFDWCLPEGVEAEEIDMSEIPGLVSYMATPLQIVPVPRLPAHLYQRITFDA